MSVFLQQAPPAGYINPPSPRSLHILYVNSFTHKRMVITDSDKATNLYTVNQRSSWSMFSSKPQMSITRHNDNSEVGVIHSFSPTKLTIHGRTFSLEKVNWMSRGRTFPSAATGTTLIWKYDSVWGNSMTCSKETNQWLARYTPSNFSMSKGGVLELASPAVDGILLDELVVTALAVVQERKLMETEAIAEGAGAAAGG